VGTLSTRLGVAPVSAFGSSLEQVKEWEREEIGLSQSEVQNLSQKIKANEARLEKLISTYLDGDTPKEMYLKQKDELCAPTPL